jgi:hypothetical protein
LKRRPAAVAALAVLVAGCLPFPYGPYWRPEAEGGRYSRAWCGGQEGPYTTVELTLAAGVTASVRVYEGKETRSVFAVLQVQGEPVRFEPIVRLESDGAVQVIAAPLRRTLIEGEKARRVEIGDTLGPVGGKPGVANIEIPLPPSIGDFTFRLPDARRGSTAITPAPIRFERRTTDGGFQAFNC